MKYRP